MLKKSFVLFSFLVLLFAGYSFNLPTVSAFPPGTPSKSTAQYQLDSLPVTSEDSMSGYSRDKFPHWDYKGDYCDTRELVLQRDADYYSGDCPVTSGKWYSYYDGVTVYDPSDLDIDHIVPLAEAWRSGANDWSTQKREDFANDLNGPQLIAVSYSSNRSKGDLDPSTWKPSRYSSHCGYAKWWIKTKDKWDLSLQSSEKNALQSMLNTCHY